MLAVTDTGVGMDEATRQRIFEPFFTTKPTGQGTGLGLSMVQGIVAQSGGFINVYSEPGRGTAFRIYLPALSGEGVPLDRPMPPAALQGSETILVVEDLAEVRNFAVRVLTDYGYRLLSASDADEALTICERERGQIHLLLTDVVMPRISGRELAIRFAALRPGIKVLFMSGYTDNVIVHHGVLDESASFIQKPFSPERLGTKVREALGAGQAGPPSVGS
jgi:CheY-like chemotaxis protein